MTSAPLPSPKGRSNRKPAAERRGIPRSTALNEHEAQTIDAAAQRLGMSVSAFLRNAALEAAKEGKDD